MTTPIAIVDAPVNFDIIKYHIIPNNLLPLDKVYNELHPTYMVNIVKNTYLVDVPCRVSGEGGNTGRDNVVPTHSRGALVVIQLLEYVFDIFKSLLLFNTIYILIKR